MKARKSLRQGLRSSLQNPSVGAFLAALLVLIVLLPTWWFASRWYQARLLAEARSRASGDISLRASALSAALNRRFSLLDGLYAFSQVVIQDENFGNNFETFAEGVYGSTSGIRTIAVAPGGVVYYVYPIEDNVRVVGYNPLEDPRPGVREEVERAIQSRQIVLSGPTELTDGGIGVVARKAVYQGDDYWGLVNLVVDLNPILSLAGIGVQADDYDLVLRDQSGQIFYGLEQVVQADPIDQRINLPDGIWVLSGAPKGGWQAAIRTDLLLFQLGLLTIVGLVASLVYLSVNRQAQLGVAVKQRTQELTQVNLELETDIAEREKAEAALRERETQYRSIFEAVSDGLFINTLDGVLADFNPAAAQMHGYSIDEFRNLQPPDFIHPDSYILFAEYIEKIKTGDQFRGRAIDLHRDGTPFFVEVTGKQFIYQGKPHALAVLRDVTEQVQAYQLLETRVHERTREIAALLEVARNVASTLDLSLLLDLVLNQLKTVVEYTGAGIAQLEGDKFVFLNYQGPSARGNVLNLHIPANLPSGYQEVVRLREPVIIPDIWDTSSQSLLIKQHSTDRMKESFGYVRSWLGVPLMVKDRLIGVLRIDHEQPNRFHEGHAQLVLAFANQVAVAIENARLYQRAQTLAVLEERQRLARELHDSVSQALYGIALGARTARTLLEREKIDDQGITEPIEYVMSLAEAGLAEMRALIFELRPESLEMEGLVAALNKQVEALHARHQIAILLNLCDEPPVALDIKGTLYRVAQEAMHNTVKHAQATQIVVRLACEDKNIFLAIEDNGIGFDTSQEFPGHLGLLSMRERVEGLGGQFVIESIPQVGTKIQAWIPVVGG
jgi:PAS domain S-box-containing protein